MAVDGPAIMLQLFFGYFDVKTCTSKIENIFIAFFREALEFWNQYPLVRCLI